MILFSFDLEDHTRRYEPGGRYVENSLRVLDFLDSQQIRGTFFIVGLVAKHAPSLVRAVAERGHEIACHSYRHHALSRETVDDFRDDIRQAKEILEQVSGRAVTGYRAPVLSLTRSTIWACDILSELGFMYSSSTMPARNPLFGFPGLPNRPFRWPGGLIELPCPVARIGPVKLPFLGGIYLRYMPRPLVRRLVRQAAPATVLWTYLHPYDFDATEPFVHMPDTTWLTSFLLWCNRRKTFDKLGWLFSENGCGQFSDIAAVLQDDPLLPSFQP